MRNKEKITFFARFDKTFQVIFTVLLWCLCLSLLVPIVWMLINSLKDPIDYYLNPSYSLPSAIDFENYKFVFQNLNYSIKRPEGTYVYNLPWMFYYSILWAVLPSFYGVALSTMCAYVISRYKFPGRNFIYSLGNNNYDITYYGLGRFCNCLLRRQLGIYDNMFLMILTGPTRRFCGMYFLILYAAFKGYPGSTPKLCLLTAAEHFRAFITIMLPMIIPSAMVLILLT